MIRADVYILTMLYIELAIVIVLIFVNGLLALAELAIVSSRRVRLRALPSRHRAFRLGRREPVSRSGSTLAHSLACVWLLSMTPHPGERFPDPA